MGSGMHLDWCRERPARAREEEDQRRPTPSREARAKDRDWKWSQARALDNVIQGRPEGFKSHSSSPTPGRNLPSGLEKLELLELAIGPADEGFCSGCLCCLGWTLDYPFLHLPLERCMHCYRGPRL